MLKTFVIFSCASFGFISMMHLDLENFIIEYVNPNFYNAFNVSIRRPDRSSPYYINMYLDYKQYAGENFTIKVNMYEVIGGRQVLTPLRLEFTICYFLTEDTVVGQIFREQLSRNFTCPLAPAIVKVDKLIFRTDKLPHIPIQAFTYNSLNVKTCTEIECFYVNERVLLIKVYVNIRFKYDSSTSYRNKNKSQRH